MIDRSDYSAEELRNIEVVTEYMQLAYSPGVASARVVARSSVVSASAVSTCAASRGASSPDSSARPTSMTMRPFA